MGNEIDIFNPTVTKVVEGIQGKMILVHSAERKVGKTLEASRMPKPYYLRFEQGANAINGLPYAALTSWTDFKKVNKQLTNPKTLDKVKQLYETIIFDTTDVAIKWCEQYVCASQGVSRLNDGNSGYGLWKEYENEWFKEINKLTNAGFTLYFIAHSEERQKTDPKTGEEYTQLVPKGDKRTIDVVLDLVDFIGYVKSNGFDDKGNEIPSSIFFTNTHEFQAGSRFKYMAKEITPFTAENLQKAIVEAIQKEESETGKGASLDEIRKEEEETNVKLSFEELVKEVNKYGKALFSEHKDDCKEIIENYLGQDATIKDATKKQTPQLEMILSDLQDLAKDNDIKVE